MDGPNEQQIAFWNEAGGKLWVAEDERLSRQIRALGEEGLRALAAQPGEQVLDIGCGTGRTSMALAEAVGRMGHVVGVDVSRPMLALAEAAGARVPQLRFIAGDAQVFPFDEGSFDAAFSRFGVMFFADPVAAFANIRRALKPGGRLVFLCWQPLLVNDWMRVPLEAALPLLPPIPPPDPNAPGPFSLADGERVRAILTQAGFAGIALRPHAQPIGGASLADTLDLTLKVGPLGAMLREAPELAPRVTAAVEAALAPHAGADGVWLQGAVWIVSARA